MGVFVTQSKVTLTFQKRELKSILLKRFSTQNRSVILKIQEKAGGGGKGAAPLAPKSAYAIGTGNKAISFPKANVSSSMSRI